MKYPRITYAELLNMVHYDGLSDALDLIFPIMFMYGGSEDISVSALLTDIGYNPNEGHCDKFERDYLVHSADKIVTKEVILDIIGYDDTANLLEGLTIGFTKEDLRSAIRGTRSNTLKPAVQRFMASSWANISKIYTAYTTEYKPLENYSMIEDTDYTPLAKQTVKSSNKSKTDTKVDTGVYGFNSTSAVPSSTTDSNTRQEKADNEMETTTSYDGESDNTHHERSGNIGVTTSQQMLESEIKLRKLEILELIFQGLDEVICQSVYD